MTHTIWPPERPPERAPIAQRRTAPPSGWGLLQRIGRLSRLLALLSRWGHATAPGRWWARLLGRRIRVTRVAVPLARAGAGLEGLRIAFLSDVHAGCFTGEAELDRIFERIASLEPDLVCLGGDLVDTQPEELLLYRRPLARLAPPLGVFAVPGNHEYHAEPDLKLFHDVLSEAGVRVLLNQGQRVCRGGHSLWLAGVDDHSHGHPDIGAALAGAREDEPVILLSHHPDFFHESASVGVDLTLAGHTHGGQVLLFGRTPCRHSVLGYWSGHFHDEGAQLYVSRGAGVTLLPLRFGARAELPLLTIHEALP